LLEDIIEQTLFTNPELFVPMERINGWLRFASGEALEDTKKIFGDRVFRSSIILNQLVSPTTNRNPNNPASYFNNQTIFEFTKTGTPQAQLRELFCASGVANKNFSYANARQNITIHTMVLDNPLFTFIKSDDGTGLKRAKIKNLDAFKYLQKYAGDYAFDIVYPKGESFDDSEPAIAAVIASNPGA